MADQRKPLPFEPRRSADGSTPSSSSAKAVQSQPIPKAVANRMARRVAIATGVPSVMGMAVFVISYVLVSRQILDIPPGITLISSGACFLLGLLGLSYGVLSASWEPQAGTLLGLEHIKPNLQRMRSSIKAQKSSS
ncbi:MAG: PAM68 family protein [Synechococcus sp.]|nr:PAM68 family protein [Synechococcus sp.]